MSALPASTEVPFVAGGPETAFRVAPVVRHGEVFCGTMETGRWVIGPDGASCFGSLGVLLDDVLGYPIVHARPVGFWATSTEISVSFCAPVPADGSALRAESRVVGLTPSGGLAEVQVTDTAGAVVAFGTQRLRFIPETPDLLTALARPEPWAAPSGGPDEARPAVTLDQLGAALSSSGREATLTLPAGPTLSNPMNTLHGGITFCASEIAGHTAVQKPGSPLTTASVHIAYLRPGPVTGRAVFEAVTLHRGRSLAVAQVTCRNEAGKTCTLATVTCHRTD